MLLAIDTSTGTIGAALHDGRRVLAEFVHHDVRRHAELLAPAIVEVLEQAGATPQDLTALVCGVGPGPFTGLRVGVVSAQVLAYSQGLDAPQGICSLDAIAHQMCARYEGDLLVATDARRKEVYWARYEVGPTFARRREGPAVSVARDLPSSLRDLPTVGRGPQLYPDWLPHPVPGGPLDVRPAALAELAVALRGGEHPDAEVALLPAVPLYLRRPDAVALSGP